MSQKPAAQNEISFHKLPARKRIAKEAENLDAIQIPAPRLRRPQHHVTAPVHS
jgi:hypothetical protein